MPDLADDADNTIQLEIRASLHAAKKTGAARLTAYGLCHNCNDHVGEGQLFCAPLGVGLSECQVDYEYRTGRKAA